MWQNSVQQIYENNNLKKSQFWIKNYFCHTAWKLWSSVHWRVTRQSPSSTRQDVLNCIYIVHLHSNIPHQNIKWGNYFSYLFIWPISILTLAFDCGKDSHIGMLVNVSKTGKKTINRYRNWIQYCSHFWINLFHISLIICLATFPLLHVQD